MTTPTTLGQHCTVYLDAAGVQHFKIESSVDAVLAGDLPASNIFVFQVTAPLDPKADVFLRVGNVADLTLLPQGRESAVGAGLFYYLATAFTVTYDDIATASQAKLLIQQRVDNLIADWRAYNVSFLAPLNAPVTPPYTYTTTALPLTTSLETATKDAYYVAHANLLVAKGDVASAEADATATAEAASTAADAATESVATSQQCSQMLGQYNTVNTAETAFRNAVTLFAPTATTYANASLVFSQACTTFQAAAQTYIGYGTTPTAPQLATFTAAKQAWDNALTAWNVVRASFDATGLNTAIASEAIAGAPLMASLHTSMQSACSDKIALVSVAALKKTDADTAAALAVTAKTQAQVAQTAAQLVDTTSYLAVKALCPTFTALVP